MSGALLPRTPRAVGGRQLAILPQTHDLEDLRNRRLALAEHHSHAPFSKAEFAVQKRFQGADTYWGAL